MIFTDEILRALTQRIFAAAGCHTEEADRVARMLVDSNLVGHDSHGVIRIPTYVQWLKNGKVIANQTIKLVADHGPLATVDGQYGLGQTVGYQSMQLAVQKAREHGVAVIGLRNAGHLGRIGDWPQMAVGAGMISLNFVNTSGAGMLVSPFGGIDRRLSVNPFAAGIPSRDGDPLLLDMSAATIAEGKVRVALNRGEQVPSGCIVDAHGQPTQDPVVFYGDPPGSILPIAGHKGFGLSMIIEVLAGALTGGSCTNPDNADRLANGMLSIVVDPLQVMSANDFFPELQRYVEFVKSSRTLTPDGEILMPGDPERRTKERRIRDGIELDDNTVVQIAETAQSLGVDLGFEPPKVDAVPQVKLPAVEQE